MRRQHHLHHRHGRVRTAAEEGRGFRSDIQCASCDPSVSYFLGFGVVVLSTSDRCGALLLEVMRCASCCSDLRLSLPLLWWLYAVVMLVLVAQVSYMRCVCLAELLFIPIVYTLRLRCRDRSESYDVVVHLRRQVVHFESVVAHTVYKGAVVSLRGDKPSCTDGGLWSSFSRHQWDRSRSRKGVRKESLMSNNQQR